MKIVSQIFRNYCREIGQMPNMLWLIFMSVKLKDEKGLLEGLKSIHNDRTGSCLIHFMEAASPCEYVLMKTVDNI